MLNDIDEAGMTAFLTDPAVPLEFMVADEYGDMVPVTIGIEDRQMFALEFTNATGKTPQNTDPSEIALMIFIAKGGLNR